jgi:hypothetical protein
MAWGSGAGVSAVAISSVEGPEFATTVSRTLLREGKLDPDWVDALFKRAPPDSGDQHVWEPEFFRLRHFACMHLPTYYWAWARAHHDRNPETERLLGALVIRVTTELWGGLFARPQLADLRNESTLTRLLFSAGNPIALSGDARAEWDRRYKGALRELSFAWTRRDAWPRWQAMALQFASFYLPMGLPPDSAGFCDDNLDDSQAELLEKLAPRMHPDAVQLIGLWMAVASAPRDEAGIPIVDWEPVAGRNLVGRSEAERLLLGRPQAASGSLPESA